MLLLWSQVREDGTCWASKWRDLELSLVLLWCGWRHGKPVPGHHVRLPRWGDDGRGCRQRLVVMTVVVMLVMVGGSGRWKEGKVCVGTCRRVGEGGGGCVGTGSIAIAGRMEGQVHGRVPSGTAAKLEGVAGREADVGAGVDGAEGRGDGAVACRDFGTTAAELEGGGAGDGAHVVGGVAAVRLVSTAREELGLQFAQLHGRVEEVLKLLARGPVGVFREDGLDLVGAEPREVHLTDSVLEEAAAATTVGERVGGCGGKEVGGRVRLVLGVWRDEGSSMADGHWEEGLVACRERERESSDTCTSLNIITDTTQDTPFPTDGKFVSRQALTAKLIIFHPLIKWTLKPVYPITALLHVYPALSLNEENECVVTIIADAVCFSSYGPVQCGCTYVVYRNLELSEL